MCSHAELQSFKLPTSLIPTNTYLIKLSTKAIQAWTRTDPQHHSHKSVAFDSKMKEVDLGWADLSIPDPHSPTSTRELISSDRLAEEQSPSSCSNLADIGAAEDLGLLQEIASLPMTDLSQRELIHWKGTKSKAVKMLRLDGTQSSPLTEASGEHVASTPGRNMMSRASSVTSSFRSQLRSPHPFQNLTRRLSITSPLAARSKKAAQRSGEQTSRLSEFNKKMNSPPTPETVRKRRGFRPLSVVTSSPFDFDTEQTMEKSQGGQLALPSLSKRGEVDITNPDIRVPEPQTASSDTVNLDNSGYESVPSPSKTASIKSVIGPSDQLESDTSVKSTVDSSNRLKPDGDDLSTTSMIPSRKPVVKPTRKPAPAIKHQIQALQAAGLAAPGAEYYRNEPSRPKKSTPATRTAARDITNSKFEANLELGPRIKDTVDAMSAEEYETFRRERITAALVAKAKTAIGEKTAQRIRDGHPQPSAFPPADTKATIEEKQPAPVQYDYPHRSGEPLPNSKQQAVVRHGYSQLSALPPLNLKQHPSIRQDPFSSMEELKEMATGWTKEEIKQWYADKTGRNTIPGGRKSIPASIKTTSDGCKSISTTSKTSSDGRKSLPSDRKTSSDGRKSIPADSETVSDDRNITSDYRKTSFDNRKTYPADSPSALKKRLNPFGVSPEKEETSIFQALAEGTPVKTPASIKSKTPVTPGRDKQRIVTPSDLRSVSYTSTTDGFDKSSGGLRKVSNIFKPKPAPEKTWKSIYPISNPIPIDRAIEIAHPTATPELKQYNLERYLRITLACPSSDFDNLSLFPKHPNTSRDFKSRNLKCTDCEDKCCAICGRACCAFKAAVMALDNHKNNPAGLERAQGLIGDISKVFPYGKEVPTFLKCTECYKKICPDCCGICPIQHCEDLMCRRCKPDPWADCDWHEESERCRAISTRK